MFKSLAVGAPDRTQPAPNEKGKEICFQTISFRLAQTGLTVRAIGCRADAGRWQRFCVVFPMLTHKSIRVLCVSMNITLSSDKETIQKTREFARRQGVSLNELLRRYMDSVTRVENPETVLDEFTRNALEHGGQSSPGYRFDREEAHRR